ncbi:glucosamine inositolphosphorylceramide transferase family protein [Novosphingobium colocasiae]|uniref:Glucosamine inositolphosphorylceramide transferase 1 N-terminal domain-containing protein n=1 Tax=Novosphingobium colocasiae TaxID=1256513 RepID=A0A918UEN5_9SPHN|nr:formyl transferase [Novosphingobium colocasiae]GGY96613.1 hypothetical protein GCM10011614_09340 [Novosphingobium colocasiae]
MELKKDIWRPFLVHAPMDALIERGNLDGLTLTALPPRRKLAYDADPFALWRDGQLFVFVEAFDYRDAHGRIDCHIFDAGLRHTASRRVLSEPWHLSYPTVFEAEGETWMLPEACASGGLTLYRARAFPGEWEPHCPIRLDVVPIDATPVHWQGKWWLFYAPAGTAEQRLTHLHAAFADKLEGPWTPHPANPVLIDPLGARPGGTALVSGDTVRLPVQDCRGSYGSGLRIVTITATPCQSADAPSLAFTSGPLWSPPDAAVPYRDGLHTMSAAGPVTLVDLKIRRFSLGGLTMRPRREAQRLLRSWRKSGQPPP